LALLFSLFLADVYVVAPRLKKEAASSMKRRKETLCNSTDVSNPFLGFYFSRGDGLRRKLEYRCFLTFKHVSQQHRLPVWKVQRIVMGSRVVLVDLPKDGRRVLEHLRHPAEQPAAYAAPYRGCKGKLCSRKTQTAVLASSGAANPRVPVLK
jgi:hypothetical protein